MARYRYDDFMKLPLSDLEALTGVVRDVGGQGGEGDDDYRARAWDSYKQDVANEDEWGGTEGESVGADLPER